MYTHTTKILSKAMLFALALILLMPAMPAAAVSGTTSTSQVLPIYDLQIGSQGTGPGLFSSISGVAGDSQGNIYIAGGDYNGSGIQKFDKNGNFISTIGTIGTGPGQYGGNMSTVLNIAIGPDDNLYVQDRDANQIVRYDSGGAFMQSWVLSGINILSDSTAMTVDSNGTIYVNYFGIIYYFSNTSSSPAVVTQLATDKGANSGFGCLSPGVCYKAATEDLGWGLPYDGIAIDYVDGTPTASTPLSYNPYSAAVDNSHIYVGDPTNATIHVYNMSGTELGTIGSVGTGDSQFGLDEYGRANFAQINTGPRAVYVVDSPNHRIERFVYADNLGAVSGAPAGMATVTLPEGTDITSIDVSAVSGADKDYPLGVATLNYTDVIGGAGQTHQVEYFFETSLLPSDVTPYLYSATMHTSTAITGAIITQVTQSGKTGLKVVYTVTDGGANDMDGAANGKVGSVLGLATIAAVTTTTTPTSTSTLANTGSDIVWYLIFAGIFIVSGTALQRKRLTR